MRAYRCSIIGVLLFLPLTTSAERELALGVFVSGAGQRADSSAATGNQWREPSVQISPDVRLEEREGDLQWDFRYHPIYEQFLQTQEISNWTHPVTGKLSWRINPTTRLSLSDSFGYYSSVSRFNERVGEGEVDEVVDVTEGFRESEYIRNRISASLAHRISPTQSLGFTLGHNLTDRSGGSGGQGSRQQMLSTSGNYTHVVSRRDSLGGGVSFRRSFNDGTSARGSQSTDFYNLSVSWQHQFDETLSLSATIGPTWVQAGDQAEFVQELKNWPLFPLSEDRFLKANSCPRLEDGTEGQYYYAFLADCDVIDAPLTGDVQDQLYSIRRDLAFQGSVPSGSAGSLTYFASMNLSKRWKLWSGTLSYNRQESDSLGVGTNTVSDVVTGALAWNPSPRWRANLRVGFTRYSSATDSVRTVWIVKKAEDPPEWVGPPIFGKPGGEPGPFAGAALHTGFTALEVPQDAYVDNLSLGLSASYRLTKRTVLSSHVSYYNSSSSGGLGVDRDYERITVNLGVRYSFDPIPF